MGQNPGRRRAGWVGPAQAASGRWARLCFLPACCVNLLAFHNKSQIINKYMPVMSKLFNRRNWKMQCGVIISLYPGRLCFFIFLTPGCASASLQPGWL